MPPFEGFFTIVNVGTIVAAILVGLQAGAFYAYSAGLGVRLWNTVVLSSMFFLTLAIVRYFAESPTWDRWIGAWFLSILFAIGVSLGYAFRVRWERRRKSR